MKIAPFLLLLVLLLPCALVGGANVTMGTINLKYSAVEPSNLLPSFFFMAGNEEGGASTVGRHYSGGLGTPIPFNPGDSCPDDIWENAMADLRVPVLPYLEQDRWTCDRTPTDLPAIVVENEFIRATVTPQFGGKIWNVYHKKFNKELFFNNPAHQPANIGYRKAWVSGGCEWNWAPGYVGHSVFTESAVYSARVPTEKGDIIRVWEYDRLNHSAWQVDMLFTEDEVWAHPRIVNTLSVDIKGYWWTCVAHQIDEMSRVLTPAQYAVFPYNAWPRSAWTLGERGPAGAGTGFTGNNDSWAIDNSYLGNIPRPNDFFVRIFKPQQPYIAHAAADGFTVVHGHPLNGTKFFTWGMSPEGDFWQDFMSASDYTHNGTHRGRYAELQIGPAPTQMQTFPIAAGSSFQWTEWFKGFFGSVPALHSANYSESLCEVERFLAGPGGISPQRIAEMDRFFLSHVDDYVEPANMLTNGSAWGGLYELMIGRPLAPGLRFHVDAADAEARPWLELLQQGTFSDTTLGLLPTSYMVEANWQALLRASAAGRGETWLHLLHLGVAAAEEGDARHARDLFDLSVYRKANPVALRCLALLADDEDSSWSLYQQAWQAAQAWNATDPARPRLLLNLAAEMARFCVALGRVADLQAFLAPLTPQYSGLDEIQHARAYLAVAQGNPNAAIALLSSQCFPTYGSDRTLLIDLWFQAHYDLARAQLGRPLTLLDMHRVRVTHPVPPNIGVPY